MEELMHQMNRRKSFVDWSKELGEIYQLQVGVHRYVILSSDIAVKVCHLFKSASNVVQEIMDRHSAVTSSRRQFPILSDIVSGGKRILFMEYGNQNNLEISYF
jgi:hypothetical protein